MALTSKIRNLIVPKLSKRKTSQFVVSKRNKSEAIFIEKIVEQPVVVVNEEDHVDLIGPPDKQSNLRLVLRKKLINETKLQQRLRELQDATQTWNHNFWAAHNKNFQNERQNYIEKYQKEGQEHRLLTADEMSLFYKEFLDKNWQVHVDYNFEWYRKNFQLLVLALQEYSQHFVKTLAFSSLCA